MALSKIKDQYLQTTVAFGNSGLPLGKRDDIDLLAIIAHESGAPSVKNFFEVLPPLEVLKKANVEAQLKKIMPDRAVPQNEESTGKESTNSSSKTTGKTNRRK